MHPRRHRGRTPSVYVRSTRLHQCRLVDGAPTSVYVSRPRPNRRATAATSCRLPGTLTDPRGKTPIENKRFLGVFYFTCSSKLLSCESPLAQTLVQTGIWTNSRPRPYMLVVRNACVDVSLITYPGIWFSRAIIRKYHKSLKSYSLAFGRLATTGLFQHSSIWCQGLKVFPMRMCHYVDSRRGSVQFP
jgi:hypothetical protein